MKKLRGILALVLIVCLACTGLAFAEDVMPEEVAPVVEEVAPVVEEAAPVVEEAAPVVEEVAPVVEEVTLEAAFGQEQQHVHDFGDIAPNAENVVRYPTCTEDGLIRFKCKNAPEGGDYGSTINANEFKEYTIHSVGHVFPKEEDVIANPLDRDNVVEGSYVAPTCTKAGEIKIKCGHNDNHVDMEANDYFIGWSACEKTQVYTLPELGHIWSDSEDGKKLLNGKPRYKVVKEATCTEQGEMVNYCLVCDAEGDVHVATDIVPHKWTVDDVKPGTCTTIRVITYKCEVCGKTIKTTDADYDTWRKKYELVNPAELDIDPNNHDWDRGDSEDIRWHVDTEVPNNPVEPTCEEDGTVQEYRLCKRCHDAKEFRKVTLHAKGHDWKLVKTVPATCTEKELITYKCSVCGKTIKTTDADYDTWREKYPDELVNPAELHTDPNNHPVEYRVLEDDDEDGFTVPATCEKEGKNIYDCTACGTTAVASKILPALGHLEGTINLNGTCAKEGDGLKDITVTYCEREGCNGETSEDVEYIDDNIDQYKKGNSSAKEFFEKYEEDKINILEVKSGEVPEHNWGPWRVRNLPDENGPGYWFRQCLKCGKHDERIADVAPCVGEEHNFEKETKEATCTEAGYEREYCTICNTEKSYVEIPATGHVPGSIVIENEVPATIEAEGSHDEVIYCETCGEELSRVSVIDEKLKHGLYEEEEGTRLYENGIASTATGLVKFEDEWFLLSAGYLNDDFTGLWNAFGSWWTIEKGYLVNRDANGIVEFNGSKYAISEGMVWTKWNGIWWDANDEPYLLSYGEWDEDYNGLYPQGENVFLIKNGKRDLEATSYTAGKVTYAVVNGTVDFSTIIEAE